MFGTSSPRLRLFLVITSLTCIFIFSIIIMGLVGVNGKITLPRSLDKACLLYMTVEGNVTTYNNGFCLFPIIAAAVTAVFALVFLIFLAMVLRRKDDVAPKPISMALVVWSFLLALLAFAVCGEIGLGLNKGCRTLGDKSDHCRSAKKFNALYGAQIAAGIMGGFWLLTILIELFQLRGRARHPSGGISTSNISNPNLVSASTTSSTYLTSAPTPAPAAAHIQCDGSHQQPEMTSYLAPSNNQVPQQYYQAPPPLPYQQVQQTPQLQYQQPVQLTPQMQYQQVQQTPQMQYQQVQQTPQMPYQQVQQTPQMQYQQSFQQTPQRQYQQVQQTPQMQYQQPVQQTTQVQHQEVQPQGQQADYQQQDKSISKAEILSESQQDYHPPPAPPAPPALPAPPAPPAPQPHQSVQLQEPYPTHPTPVAELYPPQGNSIVDTLPSGSGSGSGSGSKAL